jgi:SAM-dependent methyltransferase
MHSKFPSDPKILAKIWPDFVDIGRRSTTEVPFLKSVFPNKDPLVFDSCLGCGATTISLKQNGVYRVISNEIDPEMLNVAAREAREREIDLQLTFYNWKDLTLSGFRFRNFDAILCLGNSLTYVFDATERDLILRNFRSLLAPDGVLIIDERNYPRILRGAFSHSGEVVYCGIDKVRCQPVYMSYDLVVMEYVHLETGEKSHLHLYPFKRGELRESLIRVGFSDVQTYGDYQKTFNEQSVEFLTHVARH